MVLIELADFTVLAVPATASGCRPTPSTGAAHTKVSTDTIVQSTRQYASGVIPSAHCVSMESNRTRDRGLFQTRIRHDARETTIPCEIRQACACAESNNRDNPVLPADSAQLSC